MLLHGGQHFVRMFAEVLWGLIHYTPPLRSNATNIDPLPPRSDATSVTTDPLPSVGEVRRRVQQGVPSVPERPPANLLPMLSDAGTMVLVGFLMIARLVLPHPIFSLLPADLLFLHAGTWFVTVARSSLLEERVRYRIAAAKLKRQKDHHDAWKAVEIAKRNRNDARAKQRCR